MKPRQAMEPFASGERLRGDDFSPEEIQAWSAAEIEGYAEIVKARPGTYQYVWNASTAARATGTLMDGAIPTPWDWAASPATNSCWSSTASTG
ncbi:MAG: hypothetical protein U1F77_01280 [Kiritimatiellia bacterium]